MLNSNKDHTSLIQYFYEIIDKMPNCIFAFISTFLCGLIVHGFALVNPPLSYDAVSYRFGLGLTSSIGRWGLDIIESIQKLFGYNYVIPPINILLAILMISLSAFYVEKILKFKNKFTIFLFTFLMVANPSIVNLVHFVFTIHCYGFSILLATISVFYLLKDDEKINIFNLIISILLMGFSLGIYQAYVTFSLVLLFIYILIMALNEKLNIKNLFLFIFKFAIYFALSIIFYILFYKVYVLIRYGKSSIINGYMGMSDNVIPSIDLNFIKLTIMKCFGIILLLYKKTYASLNTTFLSKCLYPFMIILLFISYVCILYKKIQKKEYLNLIIFSLMLLLSPLFFVSIKFINVAQTYTRMTYTICLFFTLPCILLFESSDFDFINLKLKKIISFFIVLTSIILMAHFTNMAHGNYYDNYLSNKMSEQYANQLVTKIEMFPGYKKGMPLFISKTTPDCWPTYVKAEYRNYLFDKNTYDLFDEINFNLNIQAALEFFAGFVPISPSEKDVEIIKNTKEFKDMSYYPSDGSVKIINDVIVVKID